MFKPDRRHQRPGWVHLAGRAPGMAATLLPASRRCSTADKRRRVSRAVNAKQMRAGSLACREPAGWSVRGGTWAPRRGASAVRADARDDLAASRHLAEKAQQLERSLPGEKRGLTAHQAGRARPGAEAVPSSISGR